VDANTRGEGKVREFSRDVPSSLSWWVAGESDCNAYASEARLLGVVLAESRAGAIEDEDLRRGVTIQQCFLGLECHWVKRSATISQTRYVLFGKVIL